MATDPIAATLRTLRKRSGLSQRDLADILGFRSEFPVSRHERSMSVPSLMTALAYEIIFRVPISKQFHGLHETVEAVIEQRLADWEEKLQQSTPKGRKGAITAQKLEFCCERKDPETNQETNEAPDL